MELKTENYEFEITGKGDNLAEIKFAVEVEKLSDFLKNRICWLELWKKWSVNLEPAPTGGLTAIGKFVFDVRKIQGKTAEEIDEMMNETKTTGFEIGCSFKIEEKWKEIKIRPPKKENQGELEI